MATATIQRTRKATSVLSLIVRATIKLTRYSVYRIRSGEKIYSTTLNAIGKATGCIDTSTGESCKGFRFGGHCKHGDFAEQHFAEHGPVGVVPVVVAQPSYRDMYPGDFCYFDGECA